MRLDSEGKKAVRTRAKSGLPSFGISLVLPCPSVIEMAALAGYDFVRIDWEHALLSEEELRELLTTARLAGIPCQVRVPDLTSITSILGQEASGIMVPHVEDPKEVKKAVKLCKFAPAGSRGMDAGSRLIRCEGMKRNEYMEYASRTMDLIIQIESRKAIEQIDEILSVDGIDMVATGRADLSQELGVPGQKDHPSVIEAENYIISKALQYGKIPAVAADTAERVRELINMGVKCLLIGKDESLVAKALKKNLIEVGKRGD